MLRVLFYRNEKRLITLIEPVMHNCMTAEGLFWRPNLVHPIFMPVPLEEAAIYDPAYSGENLRYEHRHKRNYLPGKREHGHHPRQLKRKCRTSQLKRLD